MIDFTVTEVDLRPIYCPHGLRYWFRRHNLCFSDFLLNGIPASRLLETGDQLAMDAVELLRQRKGLTDGR